MESLGLLLTQASKTMSSPLTLGSTLGLLQPGMGVVQLGWLNSLEQTLSLDPVPQCLLPNVGSKLLSPSLPLPHQPRPFL